MTDTPFTPELDEQFTEPDGWRWHSFKTADGRTIRFGSVFPKDNVPSATIVCLPGLSEFGEKYFETARDCLSKNMAFWVIDWFGQGKSGRYFEHSQKRHSAGFMRDVDDLHALITGYIKHASVHPDVGYIPLAMLAHSMGANIGLQYIKKYPDVFACASFSAPMFGIRALRPLRFGSARTALGFVNLYASRFYVPGGRDWHEDMRTGIHNDLFSSDPHRKEIHKAWSVADPALRIGNITFKWLAEAAASCAIIQKKNWVSDIDIPIFMAISDHEKLVDNRVTRELAGYFKNAYLLEIKDARHEILMERHELRDQFMTHFYKLVKETIIDRPETLKPF